MPLLSPNKKTNKTSLSVRLNDEVHAQIKSYCEWAGFKKVDEFIEQAAALIFKKDKEWQEVRKSAKTE